MRTLRITEKLKQTAAVLAVFLIVNPVLTVPALAQGVDVVFDPTGADNTAGVTPVHEADNITVTIDQGVNMDAILNYTRFDVDNGETVNFVQPSEMARILNRIGGAVPGTSMIDGAINADGIVYFVNEAGVIFGANAMVDVGQLFAAAGNLSTADFNASINHFTNVNGPIENLGSLTGHQVHLVGENVTIGPAGTINVPGTATGSIVTMVAGDDVIITVTGSNVAIVLNDALAGAPTVTTGIQQAGTVNAGDGSVNMAVGDLYAMAINHPGNTTADAIVADGTLGGAGSSGDMTLGGLTGGAGGVTVHAEGNIALADDAIDTGPGTATLSSRLNISGGADFDNTVAEISAAKVDLTAKIAGSIDLDLATQDVSAHAIGEIDLNNESGSAVTVTRLRSGLSDTTFDQTGGVDADVSLLDATTNSFGLASTTAAATSRSITVTTDGGDISVDGLVRTGDATSQSSATSGNVTLTAGAGGIITGAGTVGTGDAVDSSAGGTGSSVSGNVTLIGDSVGSDADPLDLSIGSAASNPGAVTSTANAADGGIDLAAAGNLEIASLAAGAGGIGVGSTGSMSVAGNIGTADVAAGNGASGNVALTSSGDLLVDATVSTGNVDDAAASSGRIDLDSTNGSVAMGTVSAATAQTGSNLSGDTGSITIDAEGRVDLAGTGGCCPSNTALVTTGNATDGASGGVTIRTVDGTIENYFNGRVVTGTSTGADAQSGSIEATAGGNGSILGFGSFETGDATSTDAAAGTAKVGDILLSGNQIGFAGGSGIGVGFGTASGAPAGSNTVGLLSASTDGGAGDTGLLNIAAAGDLTIANGGIDSGAGGNVVLLATGAVALADNSINAGEGNVSVDGDTLSGNDTGVAAITTNGDVSLMAANGTIGQIEVGGGEDDDSTLSVTTGGATNVEALTNAFQTYNVTSSAGAAPYDVDVASTSGDTVIDLTNTGTSLLTAFSSVDDDVSVTSTDTDIVVSSVTVAGTASITSSGSILDDQNDDADLVPGINITADAIELSAQDGIGSSFLEVSTGALSATTVDGNVEIHNDFSSDNVTVSNLSTTGSAAGSVNYKQTGGTNLSGTTISTGDVTIDGGSSGGITVTTDGGHVDVAGDWSTGSNTGVADATSGSISVLAGVDGTIGGDGGLATGAAGGTNSGTVGGIALDANSVGATGAPLDVNVGAASGTTITQTGLNIEDDGVATGDVTVRSNVNPLFIDSINSSGAVSIEALSMNDATDDTGAELTDITAASIDLRAQNGIGDSATLELASTQIAANTSANAVSLVNTSASLVTLSEMQGGTAVTFVQKGGGDLLVNSSLSEGTIDISNNEAANLAGGIGVGGEISADGAVTLSTNARIIAAGGLVGSADRLDLNAGTGIGQGGGLDVFARSIAADTGTGNITLRNDNTRVPGAVTVTSLTTGTAANDVGSIDFDQTGGDDVTFQNVSAQAGNIDLSNDAGAIVVDGTVQTGDVTGPDAITSGSITITASGSITDTAGSLISTGDATGDDAAAGSATTGDIDLMAASIGTDTEALSVEIGSATNALATTDGSLAASASDAIFLDSPSDLDLRTVMGSDVDISVTGALNDEEDDDATTRDADITASGNVTLAATDGIGNLRNVEIGGAADDTGTLALTTSGTGNVDVDVLTNAFQSFDITSNGTDAHTIQVTLPGTDDIGLSSDGAVLTIGAFDPADGSTTAVVDTSQDSGGVVIGDDVSITTSDTHMDVVAMSAGGGTVTLTSTLGDIQDHMDDSAAEMIDITAAQVDLSASGGIGGLDLFRPAQKLELSTSQLSATTGNGLIVLDNTIATGDVTITDLSVTNTITGPGSLDMITLRQFGGDEGTKVELQSVTTNAAAGASSGGISVTTEGRNIDVGNIATGDALNESGRVNLEAGRNGAIFGGGRILIGNATDVGDITLSGNRVSATQGEDDHLDVTFGSAAGSPGTLNVTTDGGAGSAGGIFVEGVTSDLWLADGGIDSGTGGTVDLKAPGNINATNQDNGVAEITSANSYDVTLTAEGIGTNGALQIHGEGPQSDGKTLSLNLTGGAPTHLNVDEVDNVMFDNLVVDVGNDQDRNYTIGLVGDGDQMMDHAAGALNIRAGGIDTSTNSRNVSIHQQFSDILLDNGAINTGAGDVSLAATPGADDTINSTADDGTAEITSRGDVTLLGNGIGNDSQIEIADGNSNEDDSTLHVISTGARKVDIEVLNNAFERFQIDTTDPVPTTVDIALNGNDEISLEANAGGDALIARRVVTAEDSPNGDGGDIVNVAQDTTDIFVDFINTGSKKAILVSPGVIEDLTPGTDGVTDIIASEVLLKAQSGIGATNPLETQTGVLAAVTETGSINVHNFGALEIGTVSGFDANGVFQEHSGVDILGGNPLTDHINISTSSPLTINADSINLAGGNVAFTAGGGDTGDLTVNARVETRNGNGNIDLRGDDDVSFSAAGDVFAEGTGRVLVVADNDDLLAGQGGALTMADGTTIDAGTGQADLRADENITLGRVETLNTGSTAVTLRSDHGAIVDGGDIDAFDVKTPGGLVIDAETGVGSANQIETAVGTLDVDNATSGDIAIRQDGNLTVTQLDQDGDGAIDLRATTGNVTLIGDGASAQGGNITIDAEAGSLDVQAQVNSPEGDIALSANTNLSFTAAGDVTTGTGAGNVTLTSDTGNLTMADGTVVSSGIGKIVAGAANSVQLGSLTSQSDALDAIRINAAGGAVTDGGDTDTDVLAADGGVVIDSETGVGAGNAIDTTVAALTVTNTTGGIDIEESDALVVLGATENGTGDLRIRTTSGDLRVLGGVSAQDGTVTLRARGGKSLHVNAGVTTQGGDVNLRAADDVLFSANGDVTTNGGNVAVTADFDLLPDGQGGAVTMANGTVIDAGSGTIAVSADEDITLGKLRTLSAGAADVTLTSKSGGIVDGGDADVDVEATGGILVIDAKTGVGSDDAIETSVALLDVENDTSGNIAIDDTGSLGVVQSIQAGGGNTTLRAAGALQTARVIGDGGSIALVAGNGGGEADLTVNDVVQSGGGAIALDATGSVNFGGGGDVTSSGGNVTVTADTNMDQTGGINMANGTLINAGTGTIAMQADDAIFLGGLLTSSSSGSAVTLRTNAAVQDAGDAFVDVDAATGGLVVEAGVGVGTAGNAIETTVASLDVQSDVAGASAGAVVNIAETNDVTVTRILHGGPGDVNLSTTNGSITVAAAGSGITTTGANVTLDTTNGGAINVEDGARIDATSGNVALNAFNNITLGGISTTGNVTLNSTFGGIVDGGDAHLDVVANDLSTTEAAGVGVSNPLDVNVNTLTATSTPLGSGAIRIAEEDDLSITSIQNGSPGGAPIEVGANGTITVAGLVSSGGGPVDLTAGNDANFRSGRINSSFGNITIVADSDGLNGGGIDMDAASAAIGQASTVLRATDDVKVASVVGGTVEVTSSAGGIVDGGDLATDITATTSATLEAATGIGNGNPLEISVGSLDAHNSTSGDIDLIEANGITVTRIAQDGPGDVRLVTQGGGITLAVGEAGVSATTGKVTLSTTGGDLNVNAPISTTGGPVDLDADGSIGFGVGGDVTTQGGNVTADAVGGAITMADGAIVDAGDGTIAFGSSFNTTLGRLVTSNATDAAVSLTSGGAIVDGGDADGVDVDAANGRLTINSVNGVGDAGNALDTTVASLEIANTTNGVVNVTETDAVTVTTITNGNRPVTLSAGNTITLGSITGGAVTLNSTAGGVVDGANDTARNVDADTLTFDVATGYGSAGNAIDTRVRDFNGRTTTGDVVIINTRDNGATITELQSGTGNVDFRQNDEGGTPGDLVVHHVDAGSGGTSATGNITLNNVSRRVVLRQDVMARGTGDLTLSGNEGSAAIDVVMDAPDPQDQTIGSENGDLVIYGDGVEKTNSGTLSLTGDTIELLPVGNNRADQTENVVEDLFAGTGTGEGATTQTIIHRQRGDIQINVGRGRGEGGTTPTVIAQGDLFVSAGIGGFHTEENEVLVANGDVEIRTEDDIHLPDIAAAGDLFARSRTGSVFLLDDATSASFLTPGDQPANYIADSINLGGPLPKLPAGHPGLINNGTRPILATTDGLFGVDPETRSELLTYETSENPRQAKFTGEIFPPFNEPIPPERNPSTEIQAELGALMAESLESPQIGADVAAALPLWADEVVSFLECGLTSSNARACGSDDPRLQSQAAVNALELYRRLFENEAAIRIWLEAEPQGAEAMHYQKGFSELFGYSAELLSEEEQVRFRRMVLRSVAPAGASDADLDGMVQ